MSVTFIGIDCCSQPKAISTYVSFCILKKAEKNRADTTATAQLKAVTAEKQKLEHRIESLEDFIAQLQQELTDVRVEKVFLEQKMKVR